MSLWALIAIKNLSCGKERLAGVLSPVGRECLIRTMLDKVLYSLNASRSVQNIAIVTPGQLPVAANISQLPDIGGGLNASVAHAVRTLEAAGADELLVLHGDLPLITPEEIDEIVALGRRTSIALAPDRGRQGTNAIYLRAGTGFEFHFGTHSFERHQTEAMWRGLIPAVVDLPGIAFDVDEPSDLGQLLELQSATFHFLTNHGATRHDHQCSPNTF